MIYVGTLDGVLYAISSDGSLRWSLSLTDGAGTWSISPPSIGRDGTVYTGAFTHLYAIYSSSMGLDENAPWPKFHHDNQNTGQAD